MILCYKHTGACACVLENVVRVSLTTPLQDSTPHNHSTYEYIYAQIYIDDTCDLQIV